MILINIGGKVMACFIVPMTEAIVTTLVQKNIEKKEKQAGNEQIEKSGLTWSRKLSWLNKLLWGGTILLAFEHLWHGEITPWPPFLTAMGNPSDIVPMLKEVATVGVGMAVFVTIIWLVMVWIADAKSKSVSIQKTKTVGGGA
jgi:hypothetical protein